MANLTRSTDLGNGTYLNPIIFGHYSDPSVLREWNSNKIFFKIRYVDHVVSHWYSADGENWTKSAHMSAYIARSPASTEKHG